MANEFAISVDALIDSGVDLNCISERIIPSKLFTTTAQILNTANGGRIPIYHKLANVAVCLDTGSVKTDFFLSPSITQLVILGTPFLSKLYLFTVTTEGICSEQVSLKFSQANFPQKSLFYLNR